MARRRARAACPPCTTAARGRAPRGRSTSPGRPASARASIATRCRGSVGGLRPCAERAAPARRARAAARTSSPRPRPAGGGRSGPGRTCRRRRRCASRQIVRLRLPAALSAGARAAVVEEKARRAPSAPRCVAAEISKIRQARGARAAARIDVEPLRVRDGVALGRDEHRAAARATSGENAASSASIIATSRSGVARRRRRRRDGRAARQRSTCLRNRMPSPAPRCAPSMSPGMSATTSVRWSSSPSTTPRCGTSVVNG